MTTSSTMLRIAVDARYISVGNEGNGFYTYLANLLIGLQNQYSIERNSTEKEPYYHFYLLSMEEINLEDLGLSSKHFTRQLLPLPENLSSARKKSYYLNLFQQTVLSMEPKINIVFFPHLEFPRKFRQWSKHKINVVLTIHDLIPTYFLTLKSLLSGRTRFRTLSSKGLADYITIRRNHAYWDKILTVSKTSKQQILGCTGAHHSSKIVVTPLGVHKIFKPYSEETFYKILPTLLRKSFDPTHPTSTLMPLPKGSKTDNLLQYNHYLVYFGGYNVRKNVKLGIRGCTEVLTSLSALKHFKIVMVGYGTWTRTLLGREYPKHILFLKDLSNIELATLISGARFTLYASLMEGFGLPVLESIRAHTLPICSDISTNRDLLGKDYPYFNPYRLKDIKRVVRYFLTLSQKEEVALRDNALAHARPFSWEQTATLTHQAFQELGNSD